MTYELIKNKKLPSAIFAASDPIAIGAMRALKQYDIKIPEDISIIGFDNIETTNYTDPPLTTVFAPTFDMGFMAARQLFDAFKHNENISPIKILLPCFLIERILGKIQVKMPSFKRTIKRHFVFFYLFVNNLFT